MTTKRTFIGYYHVTAEGVRGVITRPAITVPKTPAQGPSSTLYTAAQIDAAIVSILENNELFPIEELNTAFSTGNIEAILNGTIADAVINGTRNAIKLGFIVPDTGPNAGYPCLSIMQKLHNLKTTAVIPVADIPEPPEEEPEWDPLWEAPAEVTSEMWDISADTGLEINVTLNSLPYQGGTPLEIAIVELMDSAEGGNIVDGQNGLPSLDLATPFNFVLNTERFTPGVTYYAQIFVGNEYDFSPMTYRKPITLIA